MPQRVPPAAEEQPAPPTLAPAESFEAFRSRTLAQLVRDRLLRFAVSSAGLAFIGYMIFADTWVGTNADIFAALLWGFTTDIGVDALTGAAKKAAS
jgi:hypothetical protein